MGGRLDPNGPAGRPMSGGASWASTRHENAADDHAAGPDDGRRLCGRRPGGGELVSTASPTLSPGGKGCPTIPGTRCGTMSAGYRAASTGRTTLTASRQTCGEALRCTGSRGRWSVIVVASS